jgi:ectoine hydroxylase-related dioxygenase (phytanoyl-CoA dioxygenase family)
MVMASVSRAHISDDWRLGWARDGYVVLKDAVSPETAAQATQALFRKDGSDQYPLFPDDEVSKAAILNHKVLELLRTVWRSEPLAIAARRFVYGSEFSPHYDTRLLRVSNPSRFARAWYALEDIHMEAGPLYVLPGSHRTYRQRDMHFIARSEPLRQMFFDFAARRAGEKDWKDVFEPFYNEIYKRLVAKDLQEAPLRRRTLLLKAGDAVVFRRYLLHGGLSRQYPALTRRSLVVLFSACDATHWDLRFEGRELQRNEAPTRVMDFQVRKSAWGSFVHNFEADRARYWAPRSQASGN